MKTLVIHPADQTTDFLKGVYKNKPWTIVTANDVSTSLLKQLILSHDRIIMLGHGSEHGLFGANQRLIINSKLVYLLRNKIGIYIWCFANEFVDKYKLPGFYTGMFISDYEEANLFMVFATNKELEESNNLLAISLNEELENSFESIISKYQGSSDVIQYNRNLMGIN